VIVGDLHGHFLDLCRILKKFQYPNGFKYLFLGNLVDRGEFSFETILLILLLKYLYPSSVFIIRGNHEFDSMCSICGFQTEIEALYTNRYAYDLFLDIFSELPLAVLLQQNILFVHGGLSPDLKKIEQIKEIKKPLTFFDSSIISGLLWSDPMQIQSVFREGPRGRGYIFGQEEVKLFNKQNNLNLIIRGHECIPQGNRFIFENQFVTVFSASNYCGAAENSSGVLIISNSGEIQKRAFSIFKYLRRKDVVFTDYQISSNNLWLKILPITPLLSSPKKC
jgi:protein phosphatase